MTMPMMTVPMMTVPMMTILMVKAEWALHSKSILPHCTEELAAVWVVSWAYRCLLDSLAVMTMAG